MAASPRTAASRTFGLIYWENGGQEALYVAAKDQNGNQVPISGDLIPVIDPVEPSTEYYKRAQTLSTQITQLVQDDASFTGVNTTQGDALDVSLNERGTRLKQRYGTVDSQGLGLEALSQIDWLSDFDKVDDAIRVARDRLEVHASRTANALAVLRTRANFNEAIVETLQSGADKLVLADPNEEGAKLLASRTRAQFSNQALLFATRADQSVLGLFR